MTDPAAAGHGGRVPRLLTPRVAAVDETPTPTIAAPYPDADAFRRLYRGHHGFVWRVLARLGVPESQLDDASQEVFMVVYRRRHDLGRDASVRSWLYGIARRIAADARRGRMRTERRIRAVADVTATSVDPHDDLRLREAGTIVASFLDALDEDTRMVFVLMDLEGMSAPEVSVALSTKLNTVYSRLRRARAAFARLLAARSGASEVL